MGSIAILTTVTLSCVSLCIASSDIFSAIADIFQQTVSKPFLPDPIAFLPADKIIQRYGYPVETHTVETDDGYFLTMFRIPFGKNVTQTSDRRKQPVLILPPFLASASDYLLVNEEDGILPFMYANAGFDVWLGNFRGSKYALRNKYFSINDDRFWNFTLDSWNQYDTPSMINYILKTTGQRRINYFGFSLAGGSIFATLSRYPELNSKIRRITSVAPGVYEGSTTSLINKPPVPIPLIVKFYSTFFHGALVTDQAIQPVAPFICAIYAPICYLVLKIFGEYHSGQVRKATLVRISGQFPSLTAAKLYDQTGQLQKNEFSYYDYGEEGNLVEYGQPSPPRYFLNRTMVPVCGLYGSKDKVADPADVIKALSQLPRWCNADNGAVDDPNWTHVDNIWGKDAGKLVYARSIAFTLQRGSRCSC